LPFDSPCTHARPLFLFACKFALFYRDDVHDFCRDTGCHDPTKFEDLLFTLPVSIII